jgi:hypothetical protein
MLIIIAMLLVMAENILRAPLRGFGLLWHKLSDKARDIKKM